MVYWDMWTRAVVRVVPLCSHPVYETQCARWIADNTQLLYSVVEPNLYRRGKATPSMVWVNVLAWAFDSLSLSIDLSLSPLTIKIVGELYNKYEPVLITYTPYTLYLYVYHVLYMTSNIGIFFHACLWELWHLWIIHTYVYRVYHSTLR